MRARYDATIGVPVAQFASWQDRDDGRRAAAVWRAALLTASLVIPAAATAAELTITDAIRAAWQSHPGLAASAGQVEAARADAEAASGAHWPTLSLTAKAVATDEPVGAFGIRLDEQRVTQADLDVARLNAPSPIGGIGLGAGLAVPIYAGGRISAGHRAAQRTAEAEASSHERRAQELAFAVTQAYFGAEVATDGLRHADDVLEHARETERFVRARNDKGLALDADVARATAFRAEAEAGHAAAVQRLASARSSLALLAGEEAGRADLTSPLAPPPAALAAAPESPERPDVVAARMRAAAAEEAIGTVKGNLLPEVVAQGGVETLRSSIDQGATWFNVALVARWKFGLVDVRATRAAEARAGAAERARQWQERQARHDLEEARRAIVTADARVASAQEAVAASISARDLRTARHRQGLLQLTDVLDAEAGLAGARSLLLESQLQARVARAQLQLALGQPIEGVKS